MEEEELAVIGQNQIQLLKFKTGNEAKREILNIDWSFDDALKEKGMNIRVIDLYSVKPFDTETLQKNAQACSNKVIVVEDHYANGIGSAVAEAIGKIHHLYIKEIPRSGKPEELRAKYGIDADAIIHEIHKL